MKNILHYSNVFLLSVISLHSPILTKTACSATIDRDTMNAIDEVRDIIDKKYVNVNISEKHIRNGALDGMLKSLDPYSSFFDEEELNNFNSNTKGIFSGVGMEMIKSSNNNLIMVSSVFKDAPADRAGIMIGDFIVQVDDKNVSSLSLSSVSKMIRGKTGTKVKLTIFRANTNETFERILTRENIKLKNISSKVYDKHIAVIEIKMFNADTYNTFVKNINAIRKKYKINTLIVDLRNNPGGLLESAVDIANLFLSNGQLITSVKGRNGQIMFDYVAKNKAKIFNNVKVILLVNKGSASAAEVLAGCLQDYKIATLVGEQTFGKASVQEIFHTNTIKGAVKITTGQYHTPKDKPISGIGLKPDVLIPENRSLKKDAILQKALELAK